MEIGKHSWHYLSVHEECYRKGTEDTSESGLSKYHPLFWFTNETQTQKML